MTSWETAIVSLTAVELSIVSLITASWILDVLRAQFGTSGYRRLYESQDGVPIESFPPAYKHWIQFTAICASCITGLFMAVQSTISVHLDAKPAVEVALAYLQLSIWILLLGAPLRLAFERDTKARRLNLKAGIISFLAVLPATVLVSISGGFDTADSALQDFIQLRILCLIQALTAIMALMALLTIPRGPTLYHDEKLVDYQNNCSILSYITFAWFPELFSAALNSTHLGVESFPVMVKSLRAKTLFEGVPTGHSDIIRSAFRRYRYRIIMQCIIGVLSELLALGPELFLFVLLRTLEHPGQWSRYMNTWTAALCVGFLLGIRTLVDVMMWWLGWSQLEIPLRGELIATVFAKGLRKKIANGPSTKDGKAPGQKKMNVINLISTDALRSSQAFGNLFAIPRSFLKFVFSVTFLTVVVLGWQSVLMSMISLAVVQPLNVWLIKAIARATKKGREASDARLNASAEALQSARHIKFTGLESLWIQRLIQTRRNELQILWRTKLLRLSQRLLFLFGPIVKDVVAFATYVYIYGTITPSVAFTATLVLSRMDAGLVEIPTLTTRFSDAYVSIKRLNEFLNSADKLDNDFSGDSVAFKSATLAWPSDSEPTAILTDISLDFPTGGFSIITGPTGSGKSLLLASILGESEVLSGSVNIPYVKPGSEWTIPGLMAYVPQTPWAENATIRENILFGLPFQEERYRMVTDGCCLNQDFDALPDGDQTEIGALGVTLSGGQRSRVALGRALYSRAEILVLDDILSAVDAHVGTRILHTLSGELGRGRTRIMATHHARKCVGFASFVVVLRDKSVFTSGPPNELNLATGSFEEPSLSGEEAPIETKEATTKVPSKLIKEEVRAKGHVKGKVYYQYFIATGGFVAWTAILAGSFLHRTGQTWCSWWLKTWTESYQDSTSHTLLYYMSIYIGINVATCFVLLLEEIGTFLASLRASRVFFEEFIGAVMYAKLRWFDTVPVGRILNRLSADLDVIDRALCHELGRLFWLITQVMFVIAIGTLASPFMLLAAALLFTVCGYFAFYYVSAGREVRRVVSTARSPMYEQFGSVLAGLETIRGSGMSDTYRQRLFALLDNYLRTYFHQLALNRWLTFRLGAVGCAYTVLVTAVVVTLRSVDAALVGFVLSYIFRFDLTVRSVINTYVTAEINMNAAERIVEYFEVPTDSRVGQEPPAAWPTGGAVSIQDLQIKYAPELPAVLKGVSFSVQGGQRLAVVGRTGAGKSSLALALFRILEAEEGTIQIDGIDISKLSLSTFRQRLTIIPQDPVLFSGTVRNNLDPFGQHDDTELASALESVSTVLETTSAVASMPSSLDFEVSEGGKNLSHGQRQLLCLGRALISKTKIIIFDEATSAVDMETDTMIQKIIRKHFTGATIICIAHRLSTVIDFDQVLVMGDGKVLEMGSPKELFEMKTEFWKMIQSSGERVELQKALKT